MMRADATPRERQMVAETLRGQARGSMPYGVLNTLKGAVGIEDGTWRDVWRRLADLIDPACTFGPARDVCGNLELHGAIYPDRCSACGQMFIAGEPYRYCPNCGARIVRGDDE